MYRHAQICLAFLPRDWLLVYSSTSVRRGEREGISSVLHDEVALSESSNGNRERPKSTVQYRNMTTWIWWSKSLTVNSAFPCSNPHLHTLSPSLHSPQLPPTFPPCLHRFILQIPPKRVCRGARMLSHACMCVDKRRGKGRTGSEGPLPLPNSLLRVSLRMCI